MFASWCLMNSHIETMILSYSCYPIIQRQLFLIDAFQSLGLALKNCPLNLLDSSIVFRTQLFFQKKPFMSITNISQFFDCLYIDSYISFRSFRRP